MDDIIKNLDEAIHQLRVWLDALEVIRDVCKAVAPKAESSKKRGKKHASNS